MSIVAQGGRERRLVPRKEAMALLGLSEGQFDRAAARGTIRTERLSERRLYVPADELDRLLAAQDAGDRSLTSGGNPALGQAGRLRRELGLRRDLEELRTRLELFYAASHDELTAAIAQLPDQEPEGADGGRRRL